MRLTALWWWIDRWRKSSAYMDMTLEEQGAYRNVLDEAHLRGGALPVDERILAKACGDAAAWPSLRDVVMARFELRPDGWHNETLDNVLKESIRRATNQANYRARRSNRTDNAADNGTDNGASNNHHNRPASPSPSPSLVRTSLVRTGIRTNEGGEPHGDSTPTELVFRTVGRGLKTWGLSSKQVLAWVKLYPTLDVLAECRRALAWVDAESSRRKTARGMPRFLVGWLNRAMESPQRGKRLSRTGASQPPRRERWVCRHLEECPHRAACEIKLAQPKKYPVKKAQASA